ncbi:RNA recognition motif domain-containing protein [Mariprofundus ferrooxydans]|uniref:RNA-binding region RNP-1 (RNA recognition motif) n=1 Tax=Mariprofundus ferrooxydans PV-1 TaxID=314345 RepID=Q0F212_9PROT|nr:RNA-binding protein [Mariprofundus ferrooxydans]EAU55738.1 RNA-binding region RNP-1 (RNA recognition motif) [Mariprofundus ferrooxydans PV-1]KON47896.1 RNA-binding protein [Mariprofundus ferrooxydans]
MNINVGNMSFSTSDEELRELFSRFGTVASATVVTNNETNQSRGFGFVEMPDDNEGNKAIRSLNGKAFAGRKLRVNEIRSAE